MPSRRSWWTSSLRLGGSLVVGALVLLALLLPLWATAAAQTPSPTGAPVTTTATPSPLQQIKSGAEAPAGAPVVVEGRILFRIRERVGSFSSAERATAIAARVNTLITNPFVPDADIRLIDGAGQTDILSGDNILVTVTDADATAAGRDRVELAGEWRDAIASAVAAGRASFSVRSLLLGVLQALALVLACYLIVRVTNHFYRRLAGGLEAGPGPSPRWRALGNLNLYRSGSLNRLLRTVLRWARVLFWVLLALIFVPLLFSFFPWTRDAVAQVAAWLLQPLATIWNALIGYIPNLFFLAVIGLLTWGCVRLARVFFDELGNQNIKINGFDPEWATFTYRIVGFLLIVFGVIVAFPYLPGSDSPAFRGITIFLGVLFSLSSTSALSNIIAGIIQTYTGAFRVGDVICIENTTGEVVAKTLLVTRIRTWKNEIVSVPNANALSHDVMNYSVMAKENRLVLHTDVTIGYDAPWREVHRLMIAAALATPDILVDPEPFVLQTSLNDYHISYELNAYTHQASRIPRIYSALHQNIQDQFNEAGIEIMSPAFSSLRDGNQVTIPRHYLPRTYEAPAFRVAGDGGRPAAPAGPEAAETASERGYDPD